MNYFTYRALKETLAQMQETDVSPGKGEYKWLYTFASKEFQNRGDEFVKKLFAEGRSDHAQRILAQRVVLMRRWRSYFNRGLGGERAQEKFEAASLEILREQLFFPSTPPRTTRRATRRSCTIKSYATRTPRTRVS